MRFHKRLKIAFMGYLRSIQIPEETIKVVCTDESMLACSRNLKDLDSIVKTCGATLPKIRGLTRKFRVRVVKFKIYNKPLIAIVLCVNYKTRLDDFKSVRILYICTEPKKKLVYTVKELTSESHPNFVKTIYEGGDSLLQTVDLVGHYHYNEMKF